MKIRAGFVSNSSSSSFVVLFPREPKSAADVKEMLFRDETIFNSLYGENGWPTETVAETVWKDICDQKKNNIKKAEEMLMSGTIYGSDAPEYDDYSHIRDWNKKMEKYNADMDRYAKKRMKEFFNIRKLKLKKINNESVDDIFLYCFKYADEDGSYFSALEHGDLFKRLKHITISNH